MTDYPFTAEDLDALKAWGHADDLQRPRDSRAGAPRDRLHRRTHGVRRSETPADRGPRPNRHDPRRGVAVRTRSAARRLGTNIVRPRAFRPSRSFRTSTTARLRRVLGRGPKPPSMQVSEYAAASPMGHSATSTCSPDFQIDQRPHRPEPRACAHGSDECDVNIFGTLVGHDDVVHSDVHGAVVIPAEAMRGPAKGHRPHNTTREGHSRSRACSRLQRPRDAGRVARIRRNPRTAARRIAWSRLRSGSASSAADSSPKIIWRLGQHRRCRPGRRLRSRHRKSPRRGRASRRERSLRRRRRNARP